MINGTASELHGLRATGNDEFYVGPELTETSEVTFYLETMAGSPMCMVPER